MCRILKIRQNTESHSASAEYSAKLPNIRLRQAAEDYSVHPYILIIILEEDYNNFISFYKYLIILCQ